MLHDHPFGIGLNQFSMVLSQGYGANAGLPPGDQDGIVHNVYWLVTAESGYLGIATYLLFLAAPFALALRTAFSARKDIRGDLLLGAAAGLLVTYVQGKAEWIGRQTGMLALLAVMFGVIGALGNAVQREARARRV
jgi:O-antigen ligase